MDDAKKTLLDNLLAAPARLLVMGAGNILWADEGFGVRCAEAFHSRYRLEKDCRTVDGGTLGMYLLETVMATEDLLIFDCADLHRPAGTLEVLTQDEINLWSATKISAHQTGLNDVLTMAALQNKLPKRIAVIACQPAELQDYGGSLTPAVRAVVPKAVAAAVGVIQNWGYKVFERAPNEKVEPLGQASLEQDAYEKFRPSDTDAPRLGDMRFAPQTGKN